ncbi:hypothetical protein vBAbaMPhT2_215 [Acinetobacter phage vB_AbaM_PhT2]|uniref:Uncharacterized protein n=1 Tax=Acinetobacter phage vB_AbaM_PhT2 TaxID=2690230 RepID=A0A6B9SYZ7_9CAUD|nr:hypothetical protein HYQ24_gp223 [Acinetobacter phage vB_AbaM_PhT2]QHJ75818.1 hypothetical protein vBAbaMPhT2_215 [Acinetobacter phage vB_AbaM_PhT2]SSU39218.1 Uncharacterised protein [Acinetobacter baumannii]
MTYRDYDEYDAVCDMDPYDMWDDDWPEPTAQDYQEWEDEWREQYEEQPWIGIWCGNQVNKLAKMMDSTSYKSYDPKHIHPDVAYKHVYYDPIHTYAHNHGYKIAVNALDKMLKKHVGSKVCVVLWKIKNHIRYRKEWTFRSHADQVIDALLEREMQYNDYPGYLENIGLKIENGYLRKVK